MLSADIHLVAEEVGQWLKKQNLKLVTIESCTGGGIAHAITSIPGSSNWFDRGLVTYTNQSKQELADVPAELIECHGAVSREVAEAMAIGGVNNSHADIAASVTGVAGPEGGSREKPVGTVWFAWSRRSISGPEIIGSQCRWFEGDREHVRNQSIMHALTTILSFN